MFESKTAISTDTKSVISAIPSVQSPLHIVHFSNAGVKRRVVKSLQFQSFRSSELNFLSRPKRIIAVSNRKLKYAGSNYESEMSKVTSSLHKVAVYNKRSCKMKLYDVDFYHLKPIITSHHIEVKTTEKSWREKTEDLTLAFGSKNRKKIVSSRQKYESIGNDATETPISAEFIEAEMLKSHGVETAQESQVIPPQNKSATSVDEVYNVFDIISEAEYNALDSVAHTLISVTREDLETWKVNKKYCAFITYCLEINFQSLSLHKAKVLCYLDYMMCLMKKTYADFKKKNPMPEIPQPFKKYFMEKYLVNNRSFPPRMKDKLLANATVLALTINNYHVDGGLWVSSTQIPSKRLVLVAYALGCHVSESKSSKMIELKLPLFKYVPMKKHKK